MSHETTSSASPDKFQEPVSFSCLPNEVILKIFLAGTEIWRELEPRGLPFHILVSGVCTHWRVLSQGTPELWTFILPPLGKDPEECLCWTSKWLKRSGAMLLSVVLDDATVEGLANVDAGIVEGLIFSILGLLSEHMHRLRRLDIRARSSTPFERFIRHLSGAPNLRQLSLCARQSQHNADIVNSFLTQPESLKWSSLQCLPGLTKLRYQNISPPYISNLTSLDVHCLLANYEDVKTIFTASPHLTHLALRKLPPVLGSIPTQYTPIPAPSLHSIVVSNPQQDSRIQAIYLFELMVIPNLAYLEVDGNVQTSTMFGSSLASSKINKLRISNFFKFSFGSQLYHSLSSLQHLELIQVPVKQLLLNVGFRHQHLSQPGSINFRKPSRRDPLLFDGMAAGPHNNVETFEILTASPNLWQSSPHHLLWPELRSITLDTFSSDDLVAVVDFIKSREGRIQSLHLSNSAMRHLSENGLTPKGDEITPLPPGHLSFRIAGMVKQLVDVKLFQSTSYGLLDADRIPLSEML